MQEDVVINVFSKGTDIVEDEFLRLAEGADKVSVSTDKMTGKVKGTIETIDKQTGVTKKLVVEDGKLVSATESVVKVMNQQDAAQKQTTTSTSALTTVAGRFLIAIQAYKLIKDATIAIIEHMGAVQAINAQLQGLTATTAQYNTASAAFQAASNGNATVMAAMVASFAQLQTILPASSINVEAFASVMGAAANAMKASGADAKGVASGIGELSKAMADGRISGEEFAALYVKFPQLGKALSEALGMSIETMTRLGVSSDAAGAALLRQSDALAKTAEANKTLTQAIDEIKDAFFKELDALNKNYDLYNKVVGVVKAFMQALSVLIGVVTTVIKWLYDMAVALGLIATNGNAATDAINKQTAASNAQASAANNAASALGRQAAATTALGNAQAAYAPNRNPDASYRSSVPEPDYARKRNAYGNEYDIEYRASGGPVRRGSPYIVGEEGPELFVPKGSGSIVPNGGGASGALSGGSSSAQRVTAIEIVSEGVGRALEGPLKAVNATLTEILTVLKTAQASASSVGSGGSTSGTLPGTSAINNLVPTGMTTGQATGGPPVTGNLGGFGGSNGASGPSSVDAYGSVRQYAQELAKLQERYQRNLWTDPTFKFSRTQNSYAALQRYLDSIPQNIREQVQSLANSLMPPTVNGQVNGFRSGGSFKVGGSSGADSKLVQLAASPGEQVDIRTRRQVAEDEARSGGIMPGGNTIIFQIKTPDADSFARSEKQILREFAVKVSKALERA